jgi:NO-binding membrane sensor protein with MHYT domain
MPVDGFTSGISTPALAYAMSCVGSALGLSAMSRARSTTGAARSRWLILAAVAIGGTGIWVMHFIAILGFSVPGVQITYDVGITLISMLIAIVVVGVGLTVAVTGRGSPASLSLGGLLTGIGVASMHYLGMSGMKMAATIHYRPLLVLASIVIAVVAATAALWASMHIRGLPATLGAALVMGVAVTGMHYTGMAAAQMYPAAPPSSTGLTAGQLLMPLIAGIGISTVIMLFIVGLAPSEREIEEHAAIQEELRIIRERRG